MTTATISREYNALPWYGATVVIFEFSGSQDTNTIEMATRGFTSVRASLGFDVDSEIVADAGDVTSNGTLLTVNGSTVRTLIVIGR